MLIEPDYITARDTLLALAQPIGTERVPLEACAGRVLADDLVACEPVPAFDRSAYDGYAFRAEDIADASDEAPVTLSIVETIRAGTVPTQRIEAGTAARVTTGAPIPDGADAVVMFERTSFTDKFVTLFSPVRSGANIVRTGEDVEVGRTLARSGSFIDAGLSGTLAAQGIVEVEVFRKPVIGLLSTGDEVVPADGPLAPGKIRNTNRYTFAAACRLAGCEPVYLGRPEDCLQELVQAIEEGLDSCDALLLTGGVSAGEWDYTPEAMAQAGATMRIRGVDMKPGMACAFGTLGGKLLFGLSGNPASSLTSFYAVVLPALNRMCGRRDVLPREVVVRLDSDFRKKSPKTRLLRGTLDLSEGSAVLRLPESQGNVVISSAIGCDAIAVVPEGSGPLEAGTALKGFLI